MKANHWFSDARISGQIPPPASVGGLSSRPPPLPPPLPPDPSEPPVSSYLSNFPPLFPFSPSSPSELSPQTAYIEPERVVLALPYHHVSRPVVVKTNLISTVPLESRPNPRSEIDFTVASAKRARQTFPLVSGANSDLEDVFPSPLNSVLTKQNASLFPALAPQIQPISPPASLSPPLEALVSQSTASQEVLEAIIINTTSPAIGSLVGTDSFVPLASAPVPAVAPIPLASPLVDTSPTPPLSPQVPPPILPLPVN